MRREYGIKWMKYGTITLVAKPGMMLASRTVAFGIPVDFGIKPLARISKRNPTKVRITCLRRVSGVRHIEGQGAEP